jgi:hypothetical protein
MDINNSERAALDALTAEEREAVVDEMLIRVREDLEWMLSREVEPEPLLSLEPDKATPRVTVKSNGRRPR